MIWVDHVFIFVRFYIEAKCIGKGKEGLINRYVVTFCYCKTLKITHKCHISSEKKIERNVRIKGLDVKDTQTLSDYKKKITRQYLKSLLSLHTLWLILAVYEMKILVWIFIFVFFFCPSCSFVPFFVKLKHANASHRETTRREVHKLTYTRDVI